MHYTIVTPSLSLHLHYTWQMLDVDGSKRLSYAELRDGLLRLRVYPAIALTEEDFESLTEVSPGSSLPPCRHQHRLRGAGKGGWII